MPESLEFKHTRPDIATNKHFLAHQRLITLRYRSFKPHSDKRPLQSLCASVCACLRLLQHGSEDDEDMDHNTDTDGTDDDKDDIKGNTAS